MSFALWRLNRHHLGNQIPRSPTPSQYIKLRRTFPAQSSRTTGVGCPERSMIFRKWVSSSAQPLLQGRHAGTVIRRIRDTAFEGGYSALGMT
jgi:hypothetical protein